MPTAIVQSRNPALGQQHSYSLSPPPDPGCKVTWSIEGNEVTVHDDVGGLRVVGINGTMTVNVTGDTTGTTIKAVVKCGAETMGTYLLDVGRSSSENSLSATEIVTELLATLGVPVTFPYWLLMLIFFFLFKFLNWLGADWPDADEIRRHLKQIGKLLPRWLQKLLDID
jgi:hypothetical protein